MFSLKGKTALITGASAGIGAAIARRLAEAGARLIIVARREDRLNETKAALLNDFGADVHSVALDVRDRDAVGKLFATLPDSWSAIDILVNNAGLARSLDPIYAMSVSDIDDMVDTNVKALLTFTSHVVPGMIERKSGHVVNIGSTAGHDVYKGGVAYCATKHAVNVITRGLKIELHGTPVRVTTIDPGMVETEFSLVRFHGDESKAAPVYADTRPLVADDVADAVLYCTTRPERVNIAEMIITSVDQSSATLIHRQSPTS